MTVSPSGYDEATCALRGFSHAQVSTSTGCGPWSDARPCDGSRRPDISIQSSNGYHLLQSKGSELAHRLYHRVNANGDALYMGFGRLTATVNAKGVVVAPTNRPAALDCFGKTVDELRAMGRVMDFQLKR